MPEEVAQSPANPDSDPAIAVKPKRKTKSKPVEIPVEPIESVEPVAIVPITEPIIEPVTETITEPVIEPIIEPVNAIAPSDKPKGKYPTAFYVSNGIPVCPFCGDKQSTSCPESKEDCPVLLGKVVQPVLSESIQAIGQASQVDDLGDFGRD